MSNVLQIEASRMGIKVPLEYPSGEYGNDDPDLIGLGQDVASARNELLSKQKRKIFLQGQVAALTAYIDKVVVDGPGQSGAPV